MLLKLDAEKKELEIKRSELIKVKDELAEIQKKIIELENRRQTAITVIEVDIKKFQTQNESLEQENNQLKLRKDICPTCKQPIGLEINKEIIAKNQKQITENKEQLSILNDKLKKCQSFELKEQSQASIKELEVKKLEQETISWADIQRQIIVLDKFQILYTKLQQAETAVKTQKEAIEDLQKIAIAKQLQIKDVSKYLEELEIFNNKLRESESKIYGKQIIKEDLTQKTMDAKAKVGAAIQMKTRFEQLEDLFKKKVSEKKTLNEDKQIYEELALAFGKKGIQAMIIEQAIPEIEDEANKLLDKLTEGRMKVSFQTQKETKTKVMGIDGKKEHATVETLDIIISDEMGERNYEMYSGGETFRVNFAIRLAISKLLAHRAGAKLQFLVVDEGFGTQDAPGRARLVEVLDTIKSDFEKILIITHIEELKDEFPTRIEVTKGTSGSTFEVVGS